MFKQRCKQRYERFAALSLVAVLAGCSSSTTPTPTPTPVPTPPPAPTAVIAGLATTATIGSTVDVGTGLGSGDANPYGLAIAPITTGGVTAGDLIVCNYNDSKGNAGAGTTIEDLKPVAGSKPVRVAQDASLAGCNALAINPGGPIWVAAYTANDNPIYVPAKTGMSYTLATTLANAYMWNKPWGQIFGSPTPVAGSTTPAPAAFYISNAGDGSIVQANITANGLVFTQIITGFPHSVDAKYGILAPAGLTYDPSSDTLYVVSSNTNSVLAFKSVSTIPKNGIVITVAAVTSTGAYSSVTSAAYSFTGTASAQAKVVFSGAPLSYPISSALLYNGDLVVGNTGDNNLVEIQPSSGTVLGTKSVDTGAPGAIFGIATSGTTQATQKVYFNNDNANSVVSLSQ